MGYKIEICCGSADDVIQAARAGADRVELNSSLFQGGLTPSLGTLRVVRRHTDIPVMCMVRPREGGFCYTEAEYQTALTDAEVLLENGADGIVFGFLHGDGTLDEERCAAMVKLAAGRPTVFHRAIDVAPDWRAALDTLIGLGVTRVLTSGQDPNVFFGLQTVAEMVRHAAGRIEILPGAGITPKNARQVVEATGCTQVHLTLHKTCHDDSTSGNPAIHYGGALYPPEDRFRTVDGERLAAMVAQREAISG